MRRRSRRGSAIARARGGGGRRRRLLAPQGRVRDRRSPVSDLDLHALAALPDDEVKERLASIRGLGEWTADWFLARHLARPRAWPARRPRSAQGGRAPSMVMSMCARSASGSTPSRIWTAHYLLTARASHEPWARERPPRHRRPTSSCSASSGRSSRPKIPAPPEFVETWDEEWRDVAADIGGRGAVFLAEDGEGVAGAVRATMRAADVWHVVFAHVRPRARRRGVLSGLLTRGVRGGQARGSVAGHARRAHRERAARSPSGGGSASSRTRSTWLPRSTSARGAARPTRRGSPSSGAIYVQTDDATSGRARGAEVPAAHRPLGVDDCLGAAERLDPRRRRALQPRPESAAPARARALACARGDRAHARDRGRRGRRATSSGTGAGSPTSTPRVPEHYGPLPPGDVVALAANPTVVQRLTGADPRARARGCAHGRHRPTSFRRRTSCSGRLADVLGVGSSA